MPKQLETNQIFDVLNAIKHNIACLLQMIERLDNYD